MTQLASVADSIRPATAPPMMTVEVVSDFRSFLSMEAEWNTLVEEAGVPHPFLTHEWIRSWWESFGSRNQLHIVVVRERNRPIAIAPLMLRRDWMYGMRIRQLRSIHNVYTMRSDLIVMPDRPDAYGALWNHLYAHNAHWDLVELCQLPASSPALEQLPLLARKDGCLSGIWEAGDSPYLPIQGSWGAYQDQLDTKHRANLRNRFKRLGRLGAVEMKIVSSPENLDPALEKGFRLEAAAWKGKAGTSMDCHPEVKRFFTMFARRAADRGWLRLHYLAADGKDIAFEYSLSYKDRTYLLKPGYDPGYAPYSPHNLLCSLAIQRAFEEGAKEFDFLGTADPWKLAWTQRVRPHYWLYLFPDKVCAHLLRFAKFRAVPWIKGLPLLSSRPIRGRRS